MGVRTQYSTSIHIDHPPLLLLGHPISLSGYRHATLASRNRNIVEYDGPHVLELRPNRSRHDLGTASHGICIQGNYDDQDTETLGKLFRGAA